MTFVPDETSVVRAAYAINRKVGNAVVRNRVRRRLRSILRELDRPLDGAPTPLVPGAYLVSVRPDAATLPYDRLRNDVTAACRRIHPARDGAT